MRQEAQKNPRDRAAGVRDLAKPPRVARAQTLADFYRDRSVFVTGHTGFKGAWLTEWLLMMGAKVTGLSLPPATTPALFTQLGLAKRCDHRLGDVRDAELVGRVVAEVRPDIVVHLAAQSLVRPSYDRPAETYAVNVLGTVHLLDALRGLDRPCAAVMVTTDKVYANREWCHGYRECDELGGYDPYSSSKACAELAIASFRSSFFNPMSPGGTRVAVASARAGNVIGGGDWAADRLVPDAVRALARKQVIPVRHPDATRPWQHVLDPLGGYLLLARRLFEAVASPGTSPADLAGLCGPFNFGPERAAGRSVRELVGEIILHWPGRWADRSDPAAVHEAGVLELTTDKAAHLLGWLARVDFEEAVELTVALYRALGRDPAAAVRLLRRQIAAYAARIGAEAP